MKKNLLYTLCASLLFFTGCDYNEDNFEGFDDNPIGNVTQYEGEFTGTYPSDGYFLTDDAGKAELTSALNTMLSELFYSSDKGSAAKISVLCGTVTPGFESADVNYTLTNDDYDSMGTGDGEPGKYNNFDSGMDVDAYLRAFLDGKYADMTVGKTISVTYKYYSGSTTNQTKSYKRVENGWESVEIASFVADKEYTLAKEDYDSMGTESGQPGKYDNFDANMDVDFYLPIFLKENFPYWAAEGTTCKVTYKFYSGGTSDKDAFYKFNGTTWAPYNPYEDVVTVETKIAEMTFDGSVWVLDRLVGGSLTLNFEQGDYEALLQWSLENKPEYKSTQYDTEEYYFGVSTYYPNINNAYNTWRKYYNVGGEYDGLTDEQLQAIMDERLAFGIAEIVLPRRVEVPNSGLSYIVVYTVYQGRGGGDYAMSFTYDDETAKYVWTGTVVAQ